MRQIVLESSESTDSSLGATNPDSETSGVVRTAKSTKARLYTKPKRPARRLPRPRSGDFAAMGPFTLYDASDGRPIAHYRTTPPPDTTPLQLPPEPPPLEMTDTASMASSPTPPTPIDNRGHQEVASDNLNHLLPNHEVPPPPDWGLHLSHTGEFRRQEPPTARKAMDISFLLNEE